MYSKINTITFVGGNWKSIGGLDCGCDIYSFWLMGNKFIKKVRGNKLCVHYSQFNVIVTRFNDLIKRYIPHQQQFYLEPLKELNNTNHVLEHLELV